MEEILGKYKSHLEEKILYESKRMTIFNFPIDNDLSPKKIMGCIREAWRAIEFKRCKFRALFGCLLVNKKTHKMDYRA